MFCRCKKNKRSAAFFRESDFRNSESDTRIFHLRSLLANLVHSHGPLANGLKREHVMEKFMRKSVRPDKHAIFTVWRFSHQRPTPGFIAMVRIGDLWGGRNYRPWFWTKRQCSPPLKIFDGWGMYGLLTPFLTQLAIGQAGTVNIASRFFWQGTGFKVLPKRFAF